MTDIGKIGKTLGFNKPSSLTENQFVDGGHLSNSSSVEVTNMPDDLYGLITKVFQETQKPNTNNKNSNYQTEPLDLSQKHSNEEKQLDKVTLPKRLWKPKTFDFESFFGLYIKRFTANDVCNARCQMLYKDHYHCFAENGNCTDVMKGKDQLRQHGKRHSIAEELTKLEFTFCVSCAIVEGLSHYHCSHSHCEFVSTEVSNMDRLAHVESTHCVIISKRTNSQLNMTKPQCVIKRTRKTKVKKEHAAKEWPIVDISAQLSPISSVSSDNQFMEFSSDSFINTITQNNCFSILDRLSPDRNKIANNTGFDSLETSVLLNIKQHEKNFYKNGSCSRLFCNLKKGDHYHCPICDRGSSKRDLYTRHLKQRHK